MFGLIRKLVNKANYRRFLIHVAFGLGAILASLVVENVAQLHLSKDVEIIVTLSGTALASFFRKQEVQ